MQWFCELARYRLAIAPFKRCRAVEEQLQRSVCPPLANPTATERIANTPLVKRFFFFLSLNQLSWGKWNIPCRRANDRYWQFVRGYSIAFRSKWRRKYIENGNLVKNKDGDSSFLPELQRLQNDNMAIPELQYAVLWTLQWRKVLLRMSNKRYLHITESVFSVLNWFYFVHDTRGNAERGAFGCPRMKRGAPDLRVIRAGWLGQWSRWPTHASV